MFAASASPTPSGRTLLALSVAVLAACGTPTTSPVDHASLHEGASLTKGKGNSAAAAGLAQAVKATTSRFNSTTQAIRAGYAQASPCVVSPFGGMGYHWVNQSLVDPFFDPYQPEAMLYEPDAQGNLKLVAVEYIVINAGQPAPTFDGQDFDLGGSPPLTERNIPHWTLHVWLHKTNPSGLFAPFNPDVSCPAP